MQLIDIRGQTFGRLKVQEKHSTSCMWECLCACGNTVLATGTNLRRGNTTSCGCAHRERTIAFNQNTKSVQELWLVDMNLYKRKVSYRKNRTSKGLGTNQFSEKSREVAHDEHPAFQWGLSLSQYVALVTADCFYCGRSPHQKPKGICMTLDMRNGIDRMDNSKGYLPANCVACCTLCNREKRAQSVEEFIENTRRRYEHLKATGRLTSGDLLRASSSSGA